VEDKEILWKSYAMVTNKTALPTLLKKMSSSFVLFASLLENAVFVSHSP